LPRSPIDTQDGRHADALILSEKAKTARAHIDAVYVQQAKAELLQRQLREAEVRDPFLSIAPAPA